MENKEKPAIRFKGFCDDWEQRKLGEIYVERNEKGKDNLEILSVSIHHGVSNGELDADLLGKNIRRSEDKSLYKHVYYGDLVFNMMRAWQGAIGVVKSEGMVSPAYVSAIPDKNLYPEFMDYCLRRKPVITQINNLSYGVTDFRKRLYWDSFVKVSEFIDKYGIDTETYDVIKGWRANASYFYIAKEFVRDNIDVDILEELLSLGGLGIQYCIKTERAYAGLHELKDELETVEYTEFNDRYNARDIMARKKMRDLVNSDANTVTNVFSTLLER